MTLSARAGQVMSLALHGHPEQAMSAAEDALHETADTTPAERAALWYAVGVAESVQSRHEGAHAAADHCLNLAVEAQSAGWAANALSMRAMAQARLGRVEAALHDLARAEAELLRCEDPGLMCWAHTGLGYAYLEMRLYELAQPHLEQAQLLDESPFPLPEAPVVDLLNLAELHLRWAEELERAQPGPGSADQARGHRTISHQYAVRAAACADELGLDDFRASCRALELASRDLDRCADSLDELHRAYTADGTIWHQGGRASVGGAYARALWANGRRRKAADVAREAAYSASAASDWQVGASAQWLVVQMEAQLGIPGAASGRAYGELLSRVLWQQRLSTLHGARSALQIERLNRDKVLAQRAALEDPLTGLGNRRAFDEALRELRSDRDDPDGGTTLREGPLSLLVVDLDEFKQINDGYGHTVGDEVLRAIAGAIRGVARADDLVSRLGGDEFVVLARGADPAVGRDLAGRVTAAVAALAVGAREEVLRLSASVGVATAHTGDDSALLLARADEAMYAAKRAGRERRADALTPRRPPG